MKYHNKTLFKAGKERKNSYQKMKRSPGERYTQTQTPRKLVIFWQSQMHFSNRRVQMYVNMR